MNYKFKFNLDDLERNLISYFINLKAHLNNYQIL